MSNMDIKKVKKNINDAMHKKGYKQKDISRITGMPQANVSRALDVNLKHMFTVEQLYMLAEDFDISIDELLGRTSSSSNYSVSDICSFLTYLVENDYLSFFTHSADTIVTKMEYQYSSIDDQEIPVPVQVKKAVDYNALFFHNKWVTDLPISNPDKVELLSGINDNYIINNFLNKYLQIFPLYKEGVLPHDAYKYAVEGYLDKIRADERTFIVSFGEDIPDFLNDEKTR